MPAGPNSVCRKPCRKGRWATHLPRLSTGNPQVHCLQTTPDAFMHNSERTAHIHCAVAQGEPIDCMPPRHVSRSERSARRRRIRAGLGRAGRRPAMAFGGGAGWAVPKTTTSGHIPRQFYLLASHHPRHTPPCASRQCVRAQEMAVRDRAAPGYIGV